MMNKRKYLAASITLGALFLLGQTAPDGAANGESFLAQLAPEPVYQGYNRSSAYIPARDGTRLAVTFYLPKAASSARFPVLLWYHPGHRESIDPATGAIRSTMTPSDIAFFTGQGYGVAIAEMRGSGASFGTRELDRGPQIGRDGKDIVDWIAAQPWSSGKVGMIGASYQGFSQYAVAGQQPAALKAIFPEIAGFDDYTSMYHPGGILLRALSEFASDSIRRDDLNMNLAQGPRRILPSVPVIDEDGDGQLHDEIPLDRNGNGDFLDDGPPVYADGQPREGLYNLATREHLANRNLPVERVAAAAHRDSPIAGTLHRYLDLDPAGKPARIMTAGIAVYNRGGWFDYHARDTVMWQATLAGKTRTHLMMAPVGHGGLPASGGEAIYRSGPYLAHDEDSRSTNEVMNREKLAFFDHYLKDLDNGFDRRPPVLLYVMGEGWRYEQEWPLKRAQNLRLRLDSGGTLSATPVKRGQDQFTTDLAANALSDGASRWNFGVSAARKPLTLDGPTGRRLSYATAPLGEDTEVTGHPLVELALSSSQSEGDVFAYLEDVAPDGSALLVTEGMLRANYHRLKPSGPDPLAKPRLPWHGFERSDYAARPFANGRRLALRFDLQPTAWRFRKGHRIRISFAAADWPSFGLHPGLAPDNDPAKAVAPIWTLWRGEGLSSVTLPVIPARK